MLGLGLGLGRNLLLGGGSDGNLVPGIDFTTWYNVPQSPMASTTKNTFTNSGTGYIQLDIGAVAGEVYTITINQTRGAGTCLIYLAADQGVDQADDVWGLEGGEETITLVADGPWLTFRASVGDTTTTVTELKVVKTAELPALIYRLFGDGGEGAFYQASPSLIGEQVLFEDSAGVSPIAQGPAATGLMRDISGQGRDAYQDSSSNRPTYSDGKLSHDGVDDWMFIHSSQSTGEYMLCIALSFYDIQATGMILGGSVISSSGPKFGIVSGNGFLRLVDGGASVAFAVPEAEAFILSVVRQADDSVSVRVNGVSVASSTMPGTVEIDQTCGSSGSGAQTQFSEADVYALITNEKIENIDAVEAYLAGVIGLDI